MGLGDLIDGGKNLANKGLGKLEEGFDAGKKALGEGVDWTTDRIGDGLEYVGADDWADAVEDWGDDTASGLGASVGEQQLGETEEADELVHGKPDKIRESAGHMNDFFTALDNVGQGMKRLDSAHWKGEAANAFRAEFAMHPAKWLHAADACEAAGKALTAYASTVTWAQGQAQNAIDLYKKGKEASQRAVEAYNKKVDAYNADIRADRDPGPVPEPFHDPGKKDREDAHALLKEARRQRDEAAETARKAIDAAMAHAPKEPPPLSRAASAYVDGMGALAVETTHVVGGVVKGTAGLLNFARGLNPLDVYNLTHPAQYAQNVNMTLAGLVSTAAHPERIPGALIDSFKGDPSEGFGRLLPELIGTKGLGSVRTGVRVAAKEGAETAVEQGVRKAAKEGADWSDLAKKTDHVKEKAIHADSVPPEKAREFLDKEFPWMKDLNPYPRPGYTENCTHNVVTVDRRLDGVEVSTAPRPGAGGLPFKELGVTPDAHKIVKGYDDIIRDLEQRGDGARSVVTIRRENGTGHVFNSIKTDHGVVFLDGQTGSLGLLERTKITEIGHIPYR
ncbi:putative T7SS-secreted protein [Streptomyces sp. NPDC095613]|uniref:putative T7SS-secreted protein n=1 Tax=Streptomyces sp. NPDC095613 TaxID=3155540 RepID=UPI003316EA07